MILFIMLFFFSSRRRHTRLQGDWSSDVCSSDLAAQTEWWYYTGHLRTDTGRKFGFEWVFFKRRTDLDRFAVVPVRLIGNPFYFAHFAITDHDAKSFGYAHRKSANGLLDVPARASQTHYYLSIGDWSARESHGMH